MLLCESMMVLVRQPAASVCAVANIIAFGFWCAAISKARRRISVRPIAGPCRAGCPPSTVEASRQVSTAQMQHPDRHAARFR